MFLKQIYTILPGQAQAILLPQALQWVRLSSQLTHSSFTLTVTTKNSKPTYVACGILPQDSTTYTTEGRQGSRVVKTEAKLGFVSTILRAGAENGLGAGRNGGPGREGYD